MCFLAVRSLWAERQLEHRYPTWFSGARIAAARGVAVVRAEPPDPHDVAAYLLTAEGFHRRNPLVAQLSAAFSAHGINGD